MENTLSKNIIHDSPPCDLRLLHSLVCRIASLNAEADRLRAEAKYARKQANIEKWILGFNALMILGITVNALLPYNAFTAVTIMLFNPLTVALILIPTIIYFIASRHAPGHCTRKARQTEKRAGEKRAEIARLRQTYAGTLDTMPEKYRTPQATAFLLHAVENDGLPFPTALARWEERISATNQ